MIKLNQAAETDLKEIWKHIAENNVEAANKTLEDFRVKFRLLEKNPKIGRERNEILVELRSFPFKITSFSTLESRMEWRFSAFCTARETSKICSTIILKA